MFAGEVSIRSHSGSQVISPYSMIFLKNLLGEKHRRIYYILYLGVAPDEQNTEFTGEITIVNEDNSSDCCVIDVSLATPCTRQSSWVRTLLDLLFDRFPILETILLRVIPGFSNGLT